MILLWFVTGASLALALVAWIRARRTAKRLAQLSQMFWELKYQHGELRIQLQRLGGVPPEPTTTAAPRNGDAFIPLTSLKR